jgi:protein SCO1/2
MLCNAFWRRRRPVGTVKGVRVVLVVAILMGAVGCRRAEPIHEYRVVGQILAVDRHSSRVTIRHQDIDGFMPGMTMPFPVRDVRLLDGRTAGETVDATLSVQGTDAWVSRLTVTGSAPITESAPVLGLGPGDRIADAALVDQDGAPMRVADLRGHPSVVTFIYTRCPLPEYCPTIEARLRSVQQAIVAEPALAGTRILAVTLDPAHDTPPVLAMHARERHADPAVWRFASGTADAVDGFGRQFGLAVTRTSGEPSGIEHNLRTVILDPDLRIAAMLTGSDWPASDAIAALRTAAGAR